MIEQPSAPESTSDARGLVDAQAFEENKSSSSSTHQSLGGSLLDAVDEHLRSTTFLRFLDGP